MPAGGGYIPYNGGPVLHTPSVFVIYWSQATIYNNGPAPGTHGTGAQDNSLIGLFLRNLGSTSWWGITAQYADNSGVSVGPIAYRGFWADNRPVSDDIDDSGVTTEIQAGLAANLIPPDDGQTVYLLLTGPGSHVDGNDKPLDIGELTYGQGSPAPCGFHGGHLGFFQPQAWLGYPIGNGCYRTNLPPSTDSVAANIVTAIAHELAEAATDPYPQGPSAYGSVSSSEIADLCVPSVTNITIGGQSFSMQALAWNVPTLTCNFVAVASLTAQVPSVLTVGFPTSVSATCVPSWQCPTTWTSSFPTAATVSSGTGNVGTVTPVTVGDTTTIKGCSYQQCGAVPTTVYAPLTGSIAGPTQVKPGATCLWSGSITSGLAPYSTSWSANGIAGTVQADGSFLGTASMTPGPATVLYYAVDARGVQGSIVKNITITSSAHTCPNIPVR